jgi:cell division septum initiation protein DivIVA
MTDKEFKRLSRAQLIEIIYQFQLKVEELTQENQTLNEALEDKRLRITRAGNIADAALEVNQVMQAAQNAAQQYLDEIKALYSEIDGECESIRAKAKAEAESVVQSAKAEAEGIVRQAQTEAAAALNRARAEASTILAKEKHRRKAEKELERIIFEYGDSSAT